MDGLPLLWAASFWGRHSSVSSSCRICSHGTRGRLRALRQPGHRGSFFDPVELDALARRARAPAERRPDLHVRSAVTLIERGRYWYRGHDPARLKIVPLGVFPDEAKLDYYRSLGVSEAVLRLPSAPRDRVLPVLDAYARFVA